MSLRILYVAYPLLAISDASCGGAEQVLLTLERELSRRGVRTTVAAAEGSRVTGELYATGKAANASTGRSSTPTLAENAMGQPSDVVAFATRDEEHNQAILRLLAEERFDLVHDMSGTFWRCAGELRVPVLATLHLPPALYAPGIFDSLSLNLYFNCVSRSQLRAFAHLPRMLGVVENGIDLSRFDGLGSRASHPCKERNGGAAVSIETSDDLKARRSGVPGSEREFLLWMGRICEEKAPHIAIDVAAAAGLPIVIAGQVYPFSCHQRYFEREIESRLRRYPAVKFSQTPAFDEKLALLDRARALLVTSQIDETSSLVAMEAMAKGTPVLAFRRGALEEVVADGVTGFVVDTQEEMVEAVNDISRIDSAACRSRVKRLYSSTRIADDYLRLYDRLLRSFALFRQSVA